MKKIYSKIKPTLLLHMIVRKKDIIDRTNVITGENNLQLATLNMEKGTTFKPHHHINKYLLFHNAYPQESWIIVQGSAKIIMYDIDNKIIGEEILYPGDASITLRGGHNYVALEEDTIVYEYKTGPYFGQKRDKKFIHGRK